MDKDKISALNTTECNDERNNCKKIVIYYGNFDKPDVSAAGKRVFGIAKILETLGYYIILIGKASKWGKRNDTTLKLTENIEFRYFPNYKIIDANKYFRWLRNTLEEENIGPTMVIRYGSPSISAFNWIIYNYFRKKNIPVIVDIVDWLLPNSGNMIFNIVKGLDIFITQMFVNKKCDGIICISNFLRDYYSNNGKRIIVIPPLVERYEEPIMSTQSTVSFIYSGIPFRKGGTVKNVHKQKERIDLTVKVISSLIAENLDVKFDIYGITKEDFATAFPDISIAENDLDRIVFHGIASMNDVQKATREADYSIVLRENNRMTNAGFSSKIVESISLNVPVITTNTGDLEDYIRNFENGYLVSLDEDLVNTFCRIVCYEQQNRNQIKTNMQSNESFLYMKYVDEFFYFLQQVLSGY